MERLITTEEVAELLRIDPVTVRRLVTRGELMAYRIAGEYRFTAANVENFVESQRVVVNAAPKNQFDKFTERSRKVLTLASEEAQQYHHDGVGTEHLLLAIMSEGEGVAAKVLQNFQVSLDEVRKQIEAQHPVGEQSASEGLIGMTPQGKQSIELAVQEARALGHHYIGTEHLLLGLLREEEGLANQILQKVGVTYEKASTRTKQLLSTIQSTGEPKEHEEP